MAPSCRFVPLGPIGLLTQEGASSGREVMSGRATAIVIHPTDSNTVYVGTAGGGVWKTTDAGAHWRALTDRQWTLSIGALAMDPSNADRIYAGTGEANISGMGFVSEGLLISDDAGDTWRRVVLSAPAGDVTMIAKIVVSKTGERVFIGTDAGLFLLRPQEPPASQLTVLDNDPVSDLVLDEHGGRLFIAKRSQGLALWSGAGAPAPLGQTGPDSTKFFPDLAPLVQNAESEFRLALAWIAAEPDTLFVAIAQDAKDPKDAHLHAVVRSDDGGATWAAVAGPLDADAARTGIFVDGQAAYNLLFGRDPQAPANLYLGLKSLFRSTSLGADWKPGVTPPPAPVTAGASGGDDLHDDQHTIAFAPTGEIWVGNDGGIWRSRDGGKTWRHRNRGLATMQFYHGGVDADLPGFIMGGAQDNGFQEFEGHPLWHSASWGDVGMVALDTRHRRIWIASNKGKVSVNENSTGFKEITYPQHYSGLFFSPFAIAPSDSNVVYAGAANLFQVDVDKTTWLPVREYDDAAHGAISAIAVSPTNPRVSYVAAYDPIFAGMLTGVVRVELGSPAVDLKLPDEPDERNGRYVSDLAISPRDDNRLYVVVGEEGGGPRPFRRRIYRCDVATKNWTDLTNNLPWFQLGSDSRDPGWNPIHAVVIDPDPAVTNAALEHVYVGCDHGVFRSWNGGDTWERIDDGLPLTPVYDLRFQQSTRRLIAFTHGRGTWMRATDVEPCAGAPTVKEVDLYLRDQRYDIGLVPTPQEVPDPIRTEALPESTEEEASGDDSADDDSDDEGEFKPAPEPPVILHSTDGVDLKIDRESVVSELTQPGDQPAFQKPASTVNYAPDGPLDTIGFEGMEHRPPNPKAPARVYLQVHNRGPDEATNVVVRVYWAAQAADASYPDLPVDFWSQYPGTDPAADSPWQPIGPASIVASVRPAEPEVVLWTWNVPAKLPAKIGLLAIVTSPDDPVDEGQPLDAMERKLEPLVRNNKRVLLKTTDTVQAAVASSGRSWGWLKWVGLAAGVGVGAAVLYEELK